jgi:hypothetical protein
MTKNVTISPWYRPVIKRLTWEVLDIPRVVSYGHNHPSFRSLADASQYIAEHGFTLVRDQDMMVWGEIARQMVEEQEGLDEATRAGYRQEVEAHDDLEEFFREQGLTISGT